jgi:three-Cys-motif partner protein
MIQAVQKFGGDWTQEKLARVQKYLTAYTTALKNTPFTLIYIDAFAGTGYREIKAPGQKPGLMFPDQAGSDAEVFHAGSARIALETEPRFAEYYFIEQDPEKCRELEKLKQEFPNKTGGIHILNADANTAIESICALTLKRRNMRGVLFLDPFGMNVSWRTIESIARTKALDMWYLFPLGVGVNRLLKRDGIIPEGWQKRLDDIFGEPNWRDIFYKTEVTPSLFGDEESITKTGGFKEIADYLVSRLKSIFAGVVDKPLPLYNSRNNPLYLLCFAAGNERGAPIAVKIAKHILKGR